MRPDQSGSSAIRQSSSGMTSPRSHDSSTVRSGVAVGVGGRDGEDLPVGGGDDRAVVGVEVEVGAAAEVRPRRRALDVDTVGEVLGREEAQGLGVDDVQARAREVAAEGDDPLVGVEGEGGALLDAVPGRVDLGLLAERARPGVGVGRPRVVVHRVRAVGGEVGVLRHLDAVDRVRDRRPPDVRRGDEHARHPAAAAAARRGSARRCRRRRARRRSGDAEPAPRVLGPQEGAHARHQQRGQLRPPAPTGPAGTTAPATARSTTTRITAAA